MIDFPSTAFLDKSLALLGLERPLHSDGLPCPPRDAAGRVP